jgi:hypothetical protein
MQIDAKLALKTEAGSESLGYASGHSDYFDLKAAGYFNGGRPMFLNVECSTTLAGTSPTETFRIESTDSADTDFSDAQIDAQSQALGPAICAAGKRVFKLPLPWGMKQLFRLAWTAGGTPNAGAFKAFLSDH